ncbi:MAG: 3-oxoacyl-ACP synthase [Gemmatimonas sp.]|nr:3-oxoacyl-ACP synthase [Gemmatimonas sp.]
MTKPTTKKPSRGRANLALFRRVSDAEIARTSPPELAELPVDFWDDAALVVPSPKKAISLRVDEDVLAWFRKSGPRYQTRMNAVLRSYVAAMRHGRRKVRARSA